MATDLPGPGISIAGVLGDGQSGCDHPGGDADQLPRMVAVVALASALEARDSGLLAMRVTLTAIAATASQAESTERTPTSPSGKRSGGSIPLQSPIFGASPVNLAAPTGSPGRPGRALASRDGRPDRHRHAHAGTSRVTSSRPRAPMLGRAELTSLACDGPKHHRR